MSKNRQNKNDRKRQRRKAFHGRDWQTASADKRSAHSKPSGTKRALTLADWARRTCTLDLSPGAVNTVDPDPCLMKIMEDLRQQQMDALLYGVDDPNTTVYGISLSDLAPPSRPPLKREMAVGEILAYRCWRLVNDHLRSVWMKDVWYPDQIMIGHGLDDWDTRGIHGWKKPGSVAYNEYVRDYLISRARSTIIVTGSVHLWGDVVEHEDGYRAEYARIRSIDWIYPNAELMGRERETLAHLRKLYGV